MPCAICRTARTGLACQRYARIVSPSPGAKEKVFSSMVMAHFCVRFTEFSRHVPWRRPHDTRFGVAARAANAISGSIGDGYIMTEELPLHEPAATRTRGAFL